MFHKNALIWTKLHQLNYFYESVSPISRIFEVLPPQIAVPFAVILRIRPTIITRKTAGGFIYFNRGLDWTLIQVWPLFKYWLHTITNTHNYLPSLSRLALIWILALFQVITAYMYSTRGPDILLSMARFVDYTQLLPTITYTVLYKYTDKSC